MFDDAVGAIDYALYAGGPHIFDPRTGAERSVTKGTGQLTANYAGARRNFKRVLDATGSGSQTHTWFEEDGIHCAAFEAGGTAGSPSMLSQIEDNVLKCGDGTLDDESLGGSEDCDPDDTSMILRSCMELGYDNNSVGDVTCGDDCRFEVTCGDTCGNGICGITGTPTSCPQDCDGNNPEPCHFKPGDGFCPGRGEVGICNILEVPLGETGSVQGLCGVEMYNYFGGPGYLTPYVVKP